MENRISIFEIKELFEKENIGAEIFCPDEMMEHKFTYLSYNSSDVTDNTFFICKGAAFKEKYLEDAVRLGAGAYIAEKKYDSVNVPCVITNDIRRAMAVLSKAFYGEAYKALKLVGLTGTKGKTTTTYFIKNILDKFCNMRTGVLSTVEVYTGVEDHDSHLTVPESPDLHKHFAQCRDSGIPYMTMEVSSQAYKVSRVYGTEYDVGVFMNIGEDHIGPLEHEDAEDYFRCKLELMKHCQTAVINKNSARFDEIYNVAKQYAKKVITFGDDTCDYWVENIQKEDVGFSFTIRCKDMNESNFRISMAGRFNVENALTAYCVAKALGVDENSIAHGLWKTEVKGRMNLFEKDGITVIVDYAHNYLSFSKLYESLKADYPGRRIVVVVGCPGGKNYIRRRDIGKLSGEYADYMYLTAEDPQFESVRKICEDIASYLEPYGTPYEIIEDRAEAVEKSLMTAKKGDVVVLAAKGEEVYQKVEGKYVPYESDLAIAKRCLEVLAVK